MLVVIKLLLKLAKKLSLMLNKKSFNNNDYLHCHLPALSIIPKFDIASQNKTLQSRACTSLCQLSDTICYGEETGRHQKLQSAVKQNNEFSPWKVKKKGGYEFYEQKQARIKKRKRRKHEYQHCLTQNKQNEEYQKVHKLNNFKQKKNKSIFFKIMGLTEVKGSINVKSQHPDLQLVACINKKKNLHHQSSQSQCISILERQDASQDPNRQITPKIVNILQDRKGQYPKMSKKRMPQGFFENQSQKLFEPSLGDHWNKRNKNYKNKVHRKAPIRDAKSVEAKHIRENYLKKRKGSISSDKQKSSQYKCINPLTRLLYQKYLYTIGVSQQKERIGHFL